MLIEKCELVAGLSFFYRTMLASAPLLELAAAQAQGGLRDYYLRHLEEERGHDEMLRDDLHRLGVGEIDRYHGAAQLAGSQYYLIAHDHPALLLGYMAVLEGNAAPLELVDQLETRHGVELNALRHHAAHDPGHLREIGRQIALLETELRARTWWNARCTADFLRNMNLPKGI
jgi:hypothetical protein